MSDDDAGCEAPGGEATGGDAARGGGGTKGGRGEGAKRHGAARGRAALAALPAPPGLCATCVHLELVGSRTSVFVRCALSDSDPRFPRYPPLPVRRCAGYEEGGPEEAGSETEEGL